MMKEQQGGLLAPHPSETAIAEYLLSQLRPLAIRLHLADQRHDIDDLIQAGIEEVIQVVRRRGITDLGYLYGVARLTMRRLMWGLPQTMSMDALLNDEGLTLHDTLAAPERQQQQGITRPARALYAALHRLPVHQQRAIHGFYQFADFTPRSGASRIGPGFVRSSNSSTIDVRRFRGLQRLRTDARFIKALLIEVTS
jgi:hypothetical protein